MGLARVNGHAEEVERLIVTSCVNCQIHVNKIHLTQNKLVGIY